MACPIVGLVDAFQEEFNYVDTGLKLAGLSYHMDLLTPIEDGAPAKAVNYDKI